MIDGAVRIRRIAKVDAEEQRTVEKAKKAELLTATSSMECHGLHVTKSLSPLSLLVEGHVKALTGTAKDTWLSQWWRTPVFVLLCCDFW